MKNVFVVDGNWYLHRCYFSLTASPKTFGDKLALMFLSLVCRDALQVKASHLLVAFDGPRIFRYNLYPEYKANRKEEEEENTLNQTKNLANKEEGFKIKKRDVYEFLPNVYFLLSKLKIPFVQPETYEADDVLCSASYTYKAQLPTNSKVIVGTKDKDCCQFLDQNVLMYDSSHKKNGKPSPKYIAVEDVEKSKQLPISWLIPFQTLTGDKVDNIPCVLTPARARKLLLEHNGSITHACENAEGKTKGFLLTQLTQLSLNAKLVTLSKEVPVPEFNSLKSPNLLPCLPTTLKQKLPKPYFDYMDWLYPKTHSLF